MKANPSLHSGVKRLELLFVIIANKHRCIQWTFGCSSVWHKCLGRFSSCRPRGCTNESLFMNMIWSYIVHFWPLYACARFCKQKILYWTEWCLRLCNPLHCPDRSSHFHTFMRLCVTATASQHEKRENVVHCAKHYQTFLTSKSSAASSSQRPRAMLYPTLSQNCHYSSSQMAERWWRTEEFLPGWRPLPGWRTPESYRAKPYQIHRVYSILVAGAQWLCSVITSFGFFTLALPEPSSILVALQISFFN